MHSINDRTGFVLADGKPTGFMNRGQALAYIYIGISGTCFSN
jgi:hypothetical protein